MLLSSSLISGTSLNSLPRGAHFFPVECKESDICGRLWSIIFERERERERERELLFYGASTAKSLAPECGR